MIPLVKTASISFCVKKSSSSPSYVNCVIYSTWCCSKPVRLTFFFGNKRREKSICYCSFFLPYWQIVFFSLSFSQKNLTSLRFQMQTRIFFFCLVLRCLYIKYLPERQMGKKRQYDNKSSPYALYSSLLHLVVVWFDELTHSENLRTGSFQWLFCWFIWKVPTQDNLFTLLLSCTWIKIKKSASIIVIAWKSTFFLRISLSVAQRKVIQVWKRVN